MESALLNADRGKQMRLRVRRAGTVCLTVARVTFIINGLRSAFGRTEHALILALAVVRLDAELFFLTL